MLKYFSIVQALSRSALATPNEAVTHQIRRLKKVWKKMGFAKEAKSLEALLTVSESSLTCLQSKIQRSFVVFKRRGNAPKTSIPVDKETSTPLAGDFFPDDLREK